VSEQESSDVAIPTGHETPCAAPEDEDRESDEMGQRARPRGLVGFDPRHSGPRSSRQGFGTKERRAREHGPL
jgi:hypothetical protein